MIDQAELAARRAEIERRARYFASHPRWQGITLDGIKRGLAGTVAEEVAHRVTGMDTWRANDVLGQLAPYAPDEARRAELHQMLVTVTTDQVLGVADEAAVQRAMALELFHEHDRYRQQIERGETVDVEALAALGAAIAAAVRRLQEIQDAVELPLAEAA